MLSRLDTKRQAFCSSYFSINSLSLSLSLPLSLSSNPFSLFLSLLNSPSLYPWWLPSLGPCVQRPIPLRGIFPINLPLIYSNLVWISSLHPQWRRFKYTEKHTHTHREQITCVLHGSCLSRSICLSWNYSAIIININIWIININIHILLDYLYLICAFKHENEICIGDFLLPWTFDSKICLTCANYKLEESKLWLVHIIVQYLSLMTESISLYLLEESRHICEVYECV